MPVMYEFADYTLDPEARTLTRRGYLVPLQDQQFRLLEFLVERAGSVVSHEEIQACLWPSDTNVEFDLSLRVAVSKLRTALRDSSSEPAYVQTLPRRGYCFIAPVSRVEEPQATPSTTPPRSDERQTETVEADAQKPAPKPSSVRRWWRATPAKITAAASAIAVCVVAFILATHFRSSDRQSRLLPQSSVVITSFQNRTGDPIFDLAPQLGLTVSFEQSPYITLVSADTVSRILREMKIPENQDLSPTVEVELCHRAAAKAFVHGIITKIGSAYSVSITAFRCDTGKELAASKAETSTEEGVLKAVDKAAVDLRSRLGESLASIQANEVPLEQATTASLEALTAYSMGQQAWDRQGERAAIPYLRHAVELDSNFAMAFAALASAYADLGDTDSATENATKAYALRDRVNGLERSVILTAYHVNVTGDLEQAAIAAEIVVKLHPEQSRSLNDLGVIEASLGHYDKATEVFRKALSLDQSEPFYSNLAISLMAIDRAAEARTVLENARRRNLQTAALSEAQYWLAFLLNDRPAMQRVVESAYASSEIQQALKCDQSITEAFDGRYEKAAQLALAAYADDTRSRKMPNNASAAECLARMAVIQAEAGQANDSRKLLIRANALSRGLSIDTLTALADARNGDTAPALAIAKKLAQDRPSDTFVQHYWLPLIRAEIALNAKRPDQAIDALEIAEPYDFANPPELLVSTLYPPYLRGRAYAMLHQPTEASQQFRKLTDHPGMVLNFPLTSMARTASAKMQGNPPAAQSPKP